MNRKKRYIVRLDEVNITREGDFAIIEYKESGVPSTQLKLGADINLMSDEMIVGAFNNMLRAQSQLAANYKHVALEIPLGSPQIRYFAEGDQWVPRGGVLRCLINDDEDGQLMVGIDDKELTLEEFGRMMISYAGWGMRIEFVPEDELHRRPAHKVGEPEQDAELD